MMLCSSFSNSNTRGVTPPLSTCVERAVVRPPPPPPVGPACHPPSAQNLSLSLSPMHDPLPARAAPLPHPAPPSLPPRTVSPLPLSSPPSPSPPQLGRGPAMARSRRPNHGGSPSARARPARLPRSRPSPCGRGPGVPPALRPRPRRGRPGAPALARRPRPRVRAAPCPDMVARSGPAGHGAPTRLLLRPWRGSASSAPARSRPLAPARSPLPCSDLGARPTPLPAPLARGVPSSGALRSPARHVVPAARPPRLALPVPSTTAACRPRRDIELGPACLWRAALSSASARPHAFSLGVALVPLAARSATRARLGPSVCAAHPRRVSAALRALLWHVTPCPRRARLPLDVPVYPPCIPCVVIALFISIHGNSI
jgi:hypothetical protein